MKPIIVGISGGSASGKTTFCNLLADELNEYKVEVLTTDKYFKKPLPKMVSPLTGEEDDDFNHPDCLDIDRFMADFNKILDEDASDVVLVEGLMILYFKEIRERLDLKIFIELDSDERMYRRIKRNIVSMGWTMEQIADYYLNYAKHREKQFVLRSSIYADIILNGNKLDGIAKDMVADWIIGKL
ncbi:MAG: hypothetical protein GX974_10360 [Clostridiales bacterium]|nr:hypothetical protein [Clostridiales bacterium]